MLYIYTCIYRERQRKRMFVCVAASVLEPEKQEVSERGRRRKIFSWHAKQSQERRRILIPMLYILCVCVQVTSGSKKVADNKIFAHPLAFNLIPHIDVFQDNLYTKEEMKVGTQHI